MAQIELVQNEDGEEVRTLTGDDSDNYDNHDAFIGLDNRYGYSPRLGVNVWIDSNTAQSLEEAGVLELVGPIEDEAPDAFDFNGQQVWVYQLAGV